MAVDRGFLKDYKDYTYIDDDGYPVYRRRNNGNNVVKNGLFGQQVSICYVDYIRQSIRPHHVFKETYNYLSDDVVHIREQEIGVRGGAFFLYGYGGTRKIFVWKALSAAIRSKGGIVINIALSGIAALLLSGGRTTHSKYHIPINLNEDSFCSIMPANDVAEVLNKAKLIICDEVSMMHCYCFEAVDRTLRDIILSSDENKPFEGTIGGHNDGEVEVEFPEDVIVPSTCDHIHSIVSTIYLSFQNHLDDPSYFQDKAILVPTNEEVGAINDYMLELMKDEGKTYMSSDSLCETEVQDFY
ncbi:uncharacterized protein LOC111905605 [Lactuca sativa]|uniref:uncharacterized protein LOC111905605 n=1 Tax=Lactuca sativa TaxID=4236 RepID=UPI0022AF5162|nr:uncharacterized protein LOC111905605 [Lactuca sativa]